MKKIFSVVKNFAKNWKNFQCDEKISKIEKILDFFGGEKFLKIYDFFEVENSEKF